MATGALDESEFGLILPEGYTFADTAVWSCTYGAKPAGRCFFGGMGIWLDSERRTRDLSQPENRELALIPG